MKDQTLENELYARTDGQIDIKLNVEHTKNKTILDLTTDILLSYFAGYLARKILIGETNNPVRKIGGLVIEILVANEVYKNAKKIKMVGADTIYTIIRKIQ